MSVESYPLSIAWWRTPFWQSMIWKLSSCGAFACINGVVRYLTGGSPLDIAITMPIFVIIFFQNIFGSLFTFVLLRPSYREIFSTQYLSLHSMRIFSAVMGVYFWYLTIAHFPIAQSVALSFTGPVLTIIGATLFLKEQLTLSRMTAIGLSFCGAFLILQEHYALTSRFDWSSCFPIAAATCFAISKLTTRKLADLGESPRKLTIYLLGLMTPVSAIFAIMHWQTPDLINLLWLMCTGLLATYAHFSFSKAYALAEITHLMPFGFTKLILSILVGYIAFSELPPSLSIWFGIIITFCSTLILASGARTSSST